VRDKLDAWLSDGGTIRIVPIGAFAVAVLLGIIPMWLEFGAFPSWAPRDRVGTPLLLAWIVIFLATESARWYTARRATRRWEEQWMMHELGRADSLAGVIDRLCASVIPQASGKLAADHIQASLLQAMVEVTRVVASVESEVQLHAALLVPVSRREARRQVGYLQITATNRVVERRGWASFRLDAKGPAQDTYRNGRMRAVPDTTEENVRSLFRTGAYRSIATFPVALRCMQGKRLAVVSVDASVAGVFSDERARCLEQAIGPYIKLIALSLVVAGSKR
jgi:hypothetical protein